MNYDIEDASPDVHPDSSVSEAATLVGDVTVGPEASVWPGAVLRGDMGPVDIGTGTHVEDNCVVHISSVGERVMVGRSVVLDVAEIADMHFVAVCDWGHALPLPKRSPPFASRSRSSAHFALGMSHASKYCSCISCNALTATSRLSINGASYGCA